MRKKPLKHTLPGMTRAALCAALLCAASYLVIPLPFTPVVLSLHTVMVNLTGLLLTPGQAGAALLIYLLMGLCGLPVFSGGTAGPGKLFGPTGGYYFGFLFAVMAISALRGKRAKFPRYFLVTAGVGLPIQHLCAVAVMTLHNGFHPLGAFLTVSLPFLPGDLLKYAMAAGAGMAFHRTMPKHETKEF